MQAEIARQLRGAMVEHLYDRYPEPMSDSTICGVLDSRPDLSPTMEAVRRAISYLEDNNEVGVTRGEEVWIAQLTYGGVDAYESRPDMAPIADHNRLLRLKILEVLTYDSRPKSEALIHGALKRNRELDLTGRAIHRASTYLCQIALAEWVDRGVLRIRSSGTDFLYGEGVDYPGVLRPVRL